MSPPPGAPVGRHSATISSADLARLGDGFEVED